MTAIAARGLGSEIRPSIGAAGEMGDVEAVALAREGDHDAFRVLVERYQGRIYHLALRILRDEEHARDAVQDAFLKVYTALAGFQGRSSFYTWLYRLVYNHCLDLRRRDKSSRHVEWVDERTAVDEELRDVRDVGPRAPAPGPAVALERSELRAQVAEAVDALPDDARETFLLREVEDMSYTEIAEALGIPKGTVMSRLFHARRRVKETLMAAGLAVPGEDE